MKNIVGCIYAIVPATYLFVIILSCNNNESTGNEKTNNADSVKKVIERGKYLAHHVSLCMDCHSQRDFASNNILATPWAFVVVTDGVAEKEPVRFTVDLCHLRRKSFGTTGGRIGIDGC